MQFVNNNPQDLIILSLHKQVLASSIISKNQINMDPICWNRSNFKYLKKNLALDKNMRQEDRLI